MFSPIIILFFFNFNPIRSIDTYENETTAHNFTFQTELDPQNKFRLFWTIDYLTESLTFEVRVILKDANDWFAIGFSDYGEMVGADLCILWTDKKHKLHFQVSLT